MAINQEELRATFKKKEKNGIQSLFSSIAEKYDLANTFLSFGGHYSWKRKVAKIVESKVGQAGIDVCAGTNDIAIFSAKRVGKSGKVYALDFNPDMQEVGQRKVEKLNLSGVIENVCANAEELPFKDNYFDFLTIGTAARHLQVPMALKEWFRVLKPGAKMACLEFYAPPNRAWRSLYNWYSLVLMPKIGMLITGDKIGCYDYLRDSIRAFYTEQQFKELMQEAGFIDCQYARLSGGIAYIHSGTKPK